MRVLKAAALGLLREESREGLRAKRLQDQRKGPALLSLWMSEGFIRAKAEGE